MTKWNEPGYDPYATYDVACEVCEKFSTFKTTSLAYPDKCQHCGNDSKQFKKLAMKRLRWKQQDRKAAIPASCVFCYSKVSPMAKACPSCGHSWPGNKGKHPFWNTLTGKLLVQLRHEFLPGALGIVGLVILIIVIAKLV